MMRHDKAQNPTGTHTLAKTIDVPSGLACQKTPDNRTDSAPRTR
ncbi:MAG: hypothetical protein JWP76_5761 [Dactylosporangium sp.]|jgi:hypothetical protein|nr:hypothetical protein [Dactylosporangium sp.]